MREKAVILVCAMVITGMILTPLVMFSWCQEPELELLEWIIVKLGLVHEMATCPNLTTVAMDIMKQVVVLVSGAVTGYYRFLTDTGCDTDTNTGTDTGSTSGTPRRQSQVLEQAWLPYDREILESNLREGFSRRHSGDFYRRHSRTWDELMWFDRDLLAARSHHERLGGNPRRETP